VIAPRVCIDFVGRGRVRRAREVDVGLCISDLCVEDQRSNAGSKAANFSRILVEQRCRDI
jgi:hypothetical protein